MDTLVAIAVVVIVGIIGLSYLGRRRAMAAKALKDSRSRARRWVERLGGQVYSLEPKDDPAARQALADAAERFTAAGAQVERAASSEQNRLAELTAHEGLYYVRAARVSLGLDPGPELPELPGKLQAGAVTEDRSVTVDGHEYLASPAASERTRPYYPGGTVASRPVPRAGIPTRGGSRRSTPARGRSAAISSPRRWCTERPGTGGTRTTRPAIRRRRPTPMTAATRVATPAMPWPRQPTSTASATTELRPTNHRRHQ